MAQTQVHLMERNNLQPLKAQMGVLRSATTGMTDAHGIEGHEPDRRKDFQSFIK
jgi:hypothetical protein